MNDPSTSWPFDNFSASVQNKISQARQLNMTRIIIQNATILTLDDLDTFFFPGSIEIIDDKITAISDQAEGNASHSLTDQDTIIIDGTDKLVMPGMVDLHFHTSVAKVVFSQSSL